MTYSEAAKKLKDMYEKGGQRKEQVTMIHLFAIKYADEISGMSLPDILNLAEMNESYKTELRKGIKLSEYVEVKKSKV